MSHPSVTRRSVLAAVPAAATAAAASSVFAADAPPATRPSTQPTRTQIKIKELEQYYARTYGEPLNLPDRLPKEIAIISLSRIDSADTTQRLLDVFKLKDRDPVVWWLAWEALHARTMSMSHDQRQRWATGGLQAAVMPGGFPGTTVTPLLLALAEHHPTAYEDQPHRLAARVIQENNLEERDQKEALSALRKLVTTWHDPSLVRMVALQANKPGLAPRVAHVLAHLPNPPPADTDAKKMSASGSPGWKRPA